MSKVKILPQDVISKIAAGEVIERPASVVKELVENAIDAGATSIELILQDGGKKLIRLKDNGHGIDREDLETIFLRHATSKINDADDLFDIHSLGFRGEALYSIAAVADISLTSKTNTQNLKPDNQQQTTNNQEAWTIHMRGGDKINLKPDALSKHGTHIEVNELFFNTPARKKFLKSDTSELNQILNVFIPYCLLKNNIRFYLKNNEKALVDVKDTDDKRTRVAKTLNLDEKHLLQTKHTFKENDVTVEVIIGDINIVRGRRDLQFLFVNDRPVENKNISFHINHVCRLIFPPNKFPACVVYINLPPDNVDVNIHPTKREVKLKDESTICSMIRNLVENLLMTAGQAKQAAVLEKQETEPTQKALTSKARTSEVKVDKSFDTFFESQPTQLREPTDQYNFPKQSGSAETPPPSLFGSMDDSLPKKFQAARFIGFFRKKYIIFEYEDAMLLVDQHAAQERINYERFIAQMQKGTVESQRLLSPHLIKLNPKEVATFEASQEKLNACGYECTMFDAQTLAVHTYPMLISDVEKSVQNLLAGDNIARCDHDTIARRACKASIRAYEKMSGREAMFQRDELLRCLDPFTCPHGRPTVIELTEDFLDKQFLRS